MDEYTPVVTPTLALDDFDVSWLQEHMTAAYAAGSALDGTHSDPNDPGKAALTARHLYHCQAIADRIMYKFMVRPSEIAEMQSEPDVEYTHRIFTIAQRECKETLAATELFVYGPTGKLSSD